MEDVRRKPMIWHEAVAAFREVLSDPGRTMRFAGMPALVMLTLYVIIALTHPRPVDPAQEQAWEDDVLPFYLLPLIFHYWFYARMQIWWARWVLLADDGVAFLSPSLGGVNWPISAGRWRRPSPPCRCWPCCSRRWRRSTAPWWP